jgi:hypothetical protein
VLLLVKPEIDLVKISGGGKHTVTAEEAPVSHKLPLRCWLQGLRVCYCIARPRLGIPVQGNPSGKLPGHPRGK